jgi:ubiquinone/menaquinone biosynthesis C-methylase UbiE
VQETATAARNAVITLAKRQWMKLALRGVGRADAYRRLDLAYRMADPWVMDSDKERHRFRETNRLIGEAFGKVGSLLEIGCGEAHQSLYLRELCETLYGIDVSPTAIARARKRCPEAEFAACDLATQPFADEERPFDLIVAAEVLYYVKDIPTALATMSRLGRRCFVTYFADAAKHLDPHLEKMPDTHRARFAYADVEWRAVWWPAR